MSDYGGLVDRFGSSGGWENVTAGAVAPFQLAVDQNAGSMEGDVYVAGYGAGVVYRFSPGLVFEEEITGLEFPVDVAVDSAGHVFVAEINGSVLEFNSAGKPIDASGNPDPANTVIEGLLVPRALAVDSNGNLLIGTAKGLFEYTLSGGSYQRVEPAIDPSPSEGVTLTAAGNVLTELRSEFLDYKAGGSLAGRGGAGTLAKGAGIAVNTHTNNVYVADREALVVDIFEEGLAPEVPVTEGAQATSPTSFVLHGTLTGGGTTGYHFAYNTSGNCEGGPVTPSVAASSGAVQVEVKGLEALRQYSYCLVATGKFGSAPGLPAGVLETGSIPPVITGERFSGVGAHSANVGGQVNPENLSGSYHFEYATEALSVASNIKSTPETGYVAGGSVAASAQLTGLQPSSEYHFRLVAKNNREETGAGVESTFRTLGPATVALPDGRVFEMVTPPKNHDADIYYPLAIRALPLNEGIHTELPFGVARDGGAVAYMSDPTSGGTGKGGRGLGNQYLARRRAPGEWVQSNIQPPGRFTTYYRGFSSDLSTGVVVSGNAGEPGSPPLSVEAPGEGYSVLYACADSGGPCVTAGVGGSGSPYRPLNGRPLNRGPGEFATSEAGHLVHITEVGGVRGPVFAAGSGDFSSTLFEANDALPGVEGPLGSQLEESVLGEIKKGENNDYLYDNAGGRLSMVNVLPGGGVAGNATFGGPSGSAFNQPDFSRVISSDGSRVFWTDLGTGMVYARVGGVSTVQVSAGVSPAQYWTASVDSRYVFYTEGAGEQSALYRFDLEGPAGAQRVALAGLGSGVLGVIGASEDGQDVYFAAKGVLSAAANGEGVLAEPGQPNLYVSHDGGAPVFIATLSPVDGGGVQPFASASFSEQPGVGDWMPGLGNRTAEVSGGGGSVVFMSASRLASVGFPQGYPNEGNEEVYLYEAGTNRLFCVSCSSTGEPLGSVGGAAAFLPVGWIPTYLPQWVSDDGNRVFFDSVVPLVAQDTNGGIDVYEWEREGTGSCTEEVAVNGGCVFLLSGGGSESASWLLGASSSGNDVFIVTRARLAPEDQNEAFDLFDARVGGVQRPPVAVCTGTGCQGVPASPPTFATPPSGTFNGVGNFPEPKPGKQPREKKKPRQTRKLGRALRACHKQHSQRRRVVCEARARKRYGGTARVVKHAAAATGKGGR